MNAAANKEHATPSSMGPQLSIHPSIGWYDNWDANGTHHFFIIPNEEIEEITPYITYNLDMPFLELLAT